MGAEDRLWKRLKGESKEIPCWWAHFKVRKLVPRKLQFIRMTPAKTPSSSEEGA